MPKREILDLLDSCDISPIKFIGRQQFFLHSQIRRPQERLNDEKNPRFRKSHIWAPLKVPKHENFSIAFFALSEPIWVCDVGTAKKIDFFID